jgi:hypothetical protein
MAGWTDRVKADPLPWLLDESTPLVRHQALRGLLDRAADDPEGVAAREAAMRTAQQDDEGRWANRYSYAGKTVVDIDRPGRPSKWVTLRACRVLKSVVESGGNA